MTPIEEPRKFSADGCLFCSIRIILINQIKKVNPDKSDDILAILLIYFYDHIMLLQVINVDRRRVLAFRYKFSKS